MIDDELIELEEIKKYFGIFLNDIELNEDDDVKDSDIIYYDYKNKDFLFNYEKLDNVKIIIADNFDCIIKNNDDIFKINCNIFGSNLKNSLYHLYMYENIVLIGNYYIDLEKYIILIINLKENKIIMYLDSSKYYDAFDMYGNKIIEFSGYNIDTTEYIKLLKDISEYCNLLNNLNLIQNDR